MSDFWKGKNVLVTGINGFVGSSVAKRLVSADANVTGIVRDINSNHGDLLARCNIALGSITDYHFLSDVISKNEIDVIFHFAANSIVRISARDPMNTYDVNVMGTVALLEAARNVGRCRSIVVASSDKAYGDHVVLPYVENFPLIPRNTYDTSKACMDMISRSYASNYDMPICVTRCSNIYGPGDYNFSRIIPNTVRRILDGKNPVLYSDIKEMEREFIFIDDVVDACIRLAEVAPLHAGVAFNIGGTGPVSIESVVKSIGDIMGVKDAFVETIERESSFREIKRQCINADLLNDATGWNPSVSLFDGLRITVDWYTGVFGGKH